MARCRNCNKPIKWLEVGEDTPAGTMLKWKTFDKRTRAGEPYRPHICEKKEPEFRSKPPDDPWWNR